MPIGYFIDAERGVTFVRGWGELKEATLTATARALAADPRFRPAAPVLVDLREATVSNIRADFLRGYRGAVTRSAPRAIVAGTDVEVFGMARMYATLQADEGRATVVRTLQAGLKALGLPADLSIPTEFDVVFGQDDSLLELEAGE